MKTKLAILSMAGLLAAPSMADIQINGFANLIGGMTLDDNETVYGYEDDFSFEPASVFGLQVRGDISDKLSATAQIVGRGSEDYDASFEWAYMTYALSENSSISAGRVRLPLFKYSASLDVGYSYHWLTPPTSVYGVLINNMDGVRYDYTNYVGDWEYGVQVFAGRYDTGSIEAKNLAGVSIETSNEWISLRTIYAQAKITSQNDSLDFLTNSINQFAPIVPSVTTLSNNFLVEDDTIGFFELAANIDKYDWFVGAEYTRTELDDSTVATEDAWYLTAGMRFGKFTPHITFEHKESSADDILAYLTDVPAAISTGDATSDATWSALYQGFTAAALAQEEDTSALTVGVRYDVEPGLALKGEVTWFEDDVNDLNDATLLRVGVNYTF